MSNIFKFIIKEDIHIKRPWEFTKAPKDFLKTLLINEVPYIGYQTDNICYY